MTVPFASILTSGVSVLLCAVLPLGLAIWYVASRRGRFVNILVGALCFFVGAMVLESLLHQLVFRLVPTLPMMPLAYVLYGALAAGVFEETARFIGLHFLCKKPSGLWTGIGYGIGHGGIEALLVAALSSVNSLLVLLQLRFAGADALLAAVPEAGREAAAAQLQAAAALSPLDFLPVGVERLITLCFHISLSVLVWMVVTGRVRRLWLAGAILLHAGVDVGAVLYQLGIWRSLWLTELYVAVFTALTAALVTLLFRRTARQTAAG